MPFRRLARVLTETAVIMLAAVLAIRFLSTGSVLGASWLVFPGILAAAALIPTAIKKRDVVQMGLGGREIKESLAVLARSCVVVFPVMFCGLWLFRRYAAALPLQPLLGQNQNWIYWLFYQFMYVAVAEEVFFRGYVQGSILVLANEAEGRERRVLQWMSVVLSAAFFAVAHIIVQGQPAAALAFFPGLILGWLFIRTKSLLAPVLFHGLANTGYFLTAAVLA